MPVIDKVLSRIGLARKNGEVPIINDGRGNLPSIRIIGGTGLGSAAWSGRQYDKMAIAGYQWNSDVYACVSLIAAAGKQVKWWDAGGNSKSITAPADLCKAIGRHPDRLLVAGDEQKRAAFVKATANPRASIALLTKAGGAAFIENWLSYLLLSGNDYMEIERNGGRLPSMVYLQRPDRVAPVLRAPGAAVQANEQELVDAWRITAYSAARVIPPADLVHSKLFN